MKGIDVSKYQGTIDWQKVKADGVDFAILKATKKNNTLDESFQGNVLGAYLSGVKIGAYRYVYARTVEEACAEVNELLKAFNGISLPCGVWIDVEDPTLLEIPTKQLTDIIFVEQYILRMNGYRTGVYCSDSWYKKVLPINEMDYCFWVARYGKNDGNMHEEVSPLGNPKVCAWQYTSKGKVNGIKGDVDLNTSPYDLEEVLRVFS